MEPSKKLENLDRILAAEEELAPSSGFVSAVMERVREEAAAPKPIPFPWKRVVPGDDPCCGGIGVVRGAVGVEGMAEAKTPVRVTAAFLCLDDAEIWSAAWIAAALGVSLLSWLLSRRMAGRVNWCRGPSSRLLNGKDGIDGGFPAYLVGFDGQGRGGRGESLFCLREHHRARHR